MKLILSDQPLPLADAGEEIRIYDLSAMRIATCMGCFGCWTKTPGRCVIRDDAVQIYPEIARSEAVLYISRIRYGGYDTPMKTMLERAIPIQKAFIRLVDGETHHVQRSVMPKTATIIAYADAPIAPEEQAVFRDLVARNARNMCFVRHRVRFTTQAQLEATCREEVEQWKKEAF